MAFYNSGLKRIDKEQRIERNKQFARLKSNEAADDTERSSIDATVTANTAAITTNTSDIATNAAVTVLNTDARVTSIAIDGTAAWWSSTITTPMEIPTAQINMRNTQILEVRTEFWETGQTNLTPTAIASPGLELFLNLDGAATREGNFASFSFLGMRIDQAQGVAVRTADVKNVTKSFGTSNFDPSISLIPLKIASTGAWPIANANWKMRLVVTFVKLAPYTYV